MPTFSIWLTNPRTVAVSDSYFDPNCGSLPNELPIVPVVRGRNRAERVVAMLRQRDGQATFRISEFPPNQYKSEQANICFLSEEVEQGRFGKGIQALLRLADEICTLAQGDDADLVVFHNDLPAGQVGDTDKKDPEFRIDEKAKLVFWGTAKLPMNSHDDFKVFVALSRAKGGIVRHVQLHREIRPNDVSDKVQDVKEAPPQVKEAVTNIRKALDSVGAQCEVKVVRGQGYRLRSPDE